MTETTDQADTLEFTENATEPCTTEWDRDSEDTPVFAVVSAVAEASGADPLELPPLGDAIDPDALNELFTVRSESTVAKVTFEYAGYDITVRGNGEVQVRSIQND
ncbi:HalOD1 output domain-containing protein [Halomontanus rarus]|uniref:HalOD1 output domain-containing protein n=1 Tax=Halomontanus rarus TaxID=3034020 RepID=UPI00293C0744|nr:HalOD1 output domain-containing protein [Halovivax sp. KZCA124]